MSLRCGGGGEWRLQTGKWKSVAVVVDFFFLFGLIPVRAHSFCSSLSVDR